MVSLGSALFFKILHDPDRFSHLRAQKGKPSEEMVVSAWKEWLINHALSVPLLWALLSLSTVCVARWNSFSLDTDRNRGLARYYRLRVRQ